MSLVHVFITLFYGNMLSFIFVPFANSVYFKIPSFGSNTNNILYRGSAVPSSGALQFNDIKYSCLVGQVISVERVLIWDSDLGKNSDFTTRFSFTMDTLNQPNSSYGDGFAFFLAPVDFQIPLNSAGSYLGLFNISNYRESSQNQIIVIEFDSHVDSWDPPYEHVGVNINSLSSSNYTTWSAGLHSGDTVEVVISYNATTMMLIASWTYDYPTFPENSSLSYQVDLKEVLQEWVSIGFSATTGKSTEKNMLHYWEFNSSLNRKWPSTRRKSNNFLKCFMVSICTIIATAIVALMILRWRWRRTRGKSTETVPERVDLMSDINNDDTEGELAEQPTRYSYSDLYLATNGFSEENKLGEEGSGSVYKGYFPNSVNQEVAIKIIVFRAKTVGYNRSENDKQAEALELGAASRMVSRSN